MRSDDQRADSTDGGFYVQQPDGGIDVGAEEVKTIPELHKDSEGSLSSQDYDIWSRLHSFERTDKKATHFQLSRKTRGPPVDSIIARTTIDLDDDIVLEDKRILRGLPEDDKIKELPTGKRKRKWRNIHTILYYDPTLIKKTQDIEFFGTKTRKYTGTNNPGVHSYLWSKANTPAKQQELHEYCKREKIGIYAKSEEEIAKDVEMQPAVVGVGPFRGTLTDYSAVSDISVPAKRKKKKASKTAGQNGRDSPDILVE